MAPVYQRLRGDPTWHYTTIASGHDAMVVSPDALAELLLRLAA